MKQFVKRNASVIGTGVSTFLMLTILNWMSGPDWLRYLCAVMIVPFLSMYQFHLGRVQGIDEEEGRWERGES